MICLNCTPETNVDAKQAVQIAKKHVAEIFSDEPIANVGLEEVEFDEIKNVWAITVGFSRFWGHPGDFVRAFDSDAVRTFKTVRIDDESGRVRSVKHRDVTGAR